LRFSTAANANLIHLPDFLVDQMTSNAWDMRSIEFGAGEARSAATSSP
jgi:hypothetical protein